MQQAEVVLRQRIALIGGLGEPARGGFAITLDAPGDLDLGDASVVGYVQPGRVGPVLGAAEVRI